MKDDLRKQVRATRPISWTAAVDWFRWISADFADTTDTLHALSEIQREDIHKASSVKPWRFQGYEGWQTDRVRYGQRSGKVLWETSGQAAPSIMALMPRCTGSASRIDLQTTVTLSTSLRGFGTYLLGSLSPTRLRHHHNQTPCGLSVGNSGLWLGTVGRRTSRSYLRIYDKGVESSLAEPGRVWRVELEAKGSHAGELCKEPIDSLLNPSWCASYCVQSLRRAGCTWPYEELGNSTLDVRLGNDQTPTATRLAAWLSLSVRPVIQRLLTVYTAGELVTMLGLSDAVDPSAEHHAHPRRTLDDRPRRS